jgi:stearoyl-CoA desaturase (delta-9 desaturase)
MPSHQPVEADNAVKPEFETPQGHGAAMASTAEPNRNSKYDPKKPHITDTPITRTNWYKHVNWLNVSPICYAAT